MQTRKLGQFRVSAIGLGCMSMSQAYGTPDLKESERALKRALEVGYTFFDTASVYGAGHNEELVGRVLGADRDKFILASKCGIVVGEGGVRGVDCRPETIKQTCEDSLRRLNTDVIDLYYLHRRDFNVPIEESVGALAELVEEGKIRTIGLSEVSSVTLRRAHKVYPITAMQSEYSLWTRNPEHRVLEVCRELGVTFVPFSPLGRAFLTGAVRDVDRDLEENDLRRRMPRFNQENFRKNLLLLKEFERIARDNHCTMAQLALAWVLSRENGTLVPIPGTKHVKYVEENAAAVDLRISEGDLARADMIINAETVSGERYPPGNKVPPDEDESGEE
jgi:aryl-alcohol dehydrogenase-like predicted oxidoreductase